MYANPHPDDEPEAAGDSLDVSAPMTIAPLTFSAVEHPHDVAVEGTVGASVALDDRHFYVRASETLVRGTPLAIASKPPQRDPSRVRAKDLVEELHSINAQIHRIMFQVEKAVARLASSG